MKAIVLDSCGGRGGRRCSRGAAARLFARANWSSSLLSAFTTTSHFYFMPSVHLMAFFHVPTAHFVMGFHMTGVHFVMFEFVFTMKGSKGRMIALFNFSVLFFVALRYRAVFFAVEAV
jgi:hypothetical protein